MRKKAIRYLRFSDLKQSHSSIERQEMYTDTWIKHNDVELVDTFIDRGFSAKTFDRPDFNKLDAFIKKHHKHVDYLVVDQMDRFSRVAGEALTMVKSMQKIYGIQIVSVTEGIVFDYTTPGSFFRAGLQLLLAEEDNINRSIKVRGTLYAARVKEGRYVYGHPPYGYYKVGEGKAKHLVIDQEKAKVVRFIYDAFLRDVPMSVIKATAVDMGLTSKGNSVIPKILKNPVYAGMQYVAGWKDQPSGVFPAQHEAIIDLYTWELVQRKMKRPTKTKVIINEDLPLRGVLRCFCGKPLTGAASRGRWGGYYNYYKCNVNGHLNLSAISAHDKMLKIQKLMSLPDRKINEIRIGATAAFEKKLKEDRKSLEKKRTELDEVTEMLFRLEEKWISNKINQDTYERWYNNYNGQRITLQGEIGKLSKDDNNAFLIIQSKVELLSDLGYVYENATAIQKQEMLRQGFDNNLYYKDDIYRTPTMLNFLTHNVDKMRELGLLIYEKKGENLSVFPSCAGGGTRTPMP